MRFGLPLLSFLIFSISLASSVNGATVIAITSTDAPTGNTEQLCRDGAGILHYVYRNASTWIYYVNSSDNGATWSTPIKMMGGTVYEAFCGVSGNEVYVVNRRSTGAQVNVSLNNGVTWAPHTTASTTMG